MPRAGIGRSSGEGRGRLRLRRSVSGWRPKRTTRARRCTFGSILTSSPGGRVALPRRHPKPHRPRELCGGFQAAGTARALPPGTQSEPDTLLRHVLPGWPWPSDRRPRFRGRRRGRPVPAADRRGHTTSRLLRTDLRQDGPVRHRRTAVARRGSGGVPPPCGCVSEGLPGTSRAPMGRAADAEDLARPAGRDRQPSRHSSALVAALS